MKVDIEFSETGSIQPVGANSFKVVSDILIIIYVRFVGTARLFYRIERYAHADIELLVKQYDNAMISLILSDTTIEQCMSTLLSRRCREFLLEASNYNSVDSTSEVLFDDLVTLFEVIAVKNSIVVAVQMQSECLSYAELDSQAERVAYYLHRLIKVGDVVCVHADRSIN